MTCARTFIPASTGRTGAFGKFPAGAVRAKWPDASCSAMPPAQQVASQNLYPNYPALSLPKLWDSAPPAKPPGKSSPRLSRKRFETSFRNASQSRTLRGMLSPQKKIQLVKTVFIIARTAGEGRARCAVSAKTDGPGPLARFALMFTRGFIKGKRQGDLLMAVDVRHATPSPR